MIVLTRHHYAAADAVVPHEHTSTREVLFVGLTVQTYSREVRVMSDVWDTETVGVVYVKGLTRAAMLEASRAYHTNYTTMTDEERAIAHTEWVASDEDGSFIVQACSEAVTDASPELQAKFERAKKIRADEEYARDLEARRVRALEDRRFNAPRGAFVTVVKGRKVPVGTKGIIVWTGVSEGRYGGERVGIKDAAGAVHYTSASNIQAAVGPLFERRFENSKSVWACCRCDMHAQDLVFASTEEALVHLDEHLDRGDVANQDNVLELQGKREDRDLEVAQILSLTKKVLWKGKNRRFGMFIKSKFAAKCAITGVDVPAGAGYARKNDQDRWETLSHDAALKLVRVLKGETPAGESGESVEAAE